MTQDDILRMAREAGLNWCQWTGCFTIDRDLSAVQVLERFAALVATAEREACAQVCDRGAEQMLHAYKREGAARCAAAIRARGKQ